jgi:2-keto-4-pentenoate hydratase/2-oxohepta-3-ene-1,7-dioic acid hydratase in catechol pathway
MKIARGLLASGECVWAQVENPEGERVYRRLSRNPLEDPAQVEEVVTFTRLLAPLEPRAILCVGMNYRDHEARSAQTEAPFPLIIPKGCNAVQHPGEPVVLPRYLASKKVDYEGELALVIGRDCKNVPRGKALDYVFGYTCANDISARDWQFEFGGGQWARAKQFDTFCPLGPWLVTTDEIRDPSGLTLTTRLNGEIVQNASTSSLIFDLPHLISFLSGSTTLLAGTVILTGTPTGVGMYRQPQRWLRAGDEVSVAIEGIGELVNPVEEEVLI